uniref:Uncharacterized protein n=1 Tax=Sinocyclocheilus grahami TaxID=75366 RepID=A0A672KSL4_SINGR
MSFVKGVKATRVTQQRTKKPKKQTEMTQKAGEDRAILLGLGMVFSSVMMYFVICMVRAYCIYSCNQKYSPPLTCNAFSHGSSTLEGFYVPKWQKDLAALRVMIQDISHQQVPSSVFHSLFWPSCMLSGGTLIILMVKLAQYLSVLCEQIGKAD